MSQRKSEIHFRGMNGLLLGISMLVAFLIGEGVLRALGYYGAKGTKLQNLILVEDPVLDFRHVKNSSWVQNNIHFNINKHGMRDYDYNYEKDENTFRILILGDSVSFGYGINLNEIYGKQLEGKLRKYSDDDLKFEVIMLSLSGINTEQEVRLLESEGLMYDPDLIVFGYVLNDPEHGTSLRAQLSRARSMSLFHRVKMLAQKSSAINLFYKMSQKMYWKGSLLMGEGEVADYVKSDYFSSLHNGPQKWGRVVAGFKELRELRRRRQIPVVIMIFPVLLDLEKYQWEHIHHKVTNLALQNGFRVLDLLGKFCQYKAHELQIDNGDHVHPNKVGHKIAGDTLYEFLYQEKLLPNH